MVRSRILARALFVFILLVGLVAGFFLPSLIFVDAAPQKAYLPLSVIINEIAWGGTAASPSDEWMELYNPGTSDIDLSNWKIERKSISLPVTTLATITIPVGKSIPAHGYFLLERAEKAVSDITADYIYGGTNMSNSGETLELHDPSDVIIDTANAAGIAWSAGTASPTYYTMERKDVIPDSPSAWASNNGITRNGRDASNNLINGTPKQINSVTLTLTPTVTFAPSDTPTATNTPTPTSTGTPTNTPTPTASNTPTSTSTAFPARSVVINEVAWAGTSASPNDEWIELYNPGATAINLTGWTLRSLDNSPNISLAGTIAAKGYYLLARSSTTFSDLAVDQTFTGTLNNTGETLQLLDTNHYQIDTANQSGGAWPAGSASPNYASMERIGVVPDSPSAWVTFAGTNVIAHDSSGNPIRGTPGKANWASTVTETPSPTATTTSSVCPSTFSYHSLLINEVGWMGTAASSSDEWIEIYNPGSSCINLSTGWVLKIADTNINITLAGAINPGGYFILADNGSVFQNVTINQWTTTLSLLNDGEALYLIGPDGYTQVDSANWWDGNWPAGIGSSSNSNLAYSSMERYHLPNGAIPDDSPSAWVTYAGPTTNNVVDRNNNPIHGTPGMANWAWTVTETPSAYPTATKKPTPTYAPTPVPAVVLNEILARPGSDWNGDGAVNNSDEFIEVENLGHGIATLSNWRLSVTPNNGIGTYYLPSLKLNPNERKVFFGSTTHLQLEDSGETVSLIDTYGVVEDAFTYPAVLQPDDSWCRIRDGIGNWQDGCFPTPGFENALSGTLPSSPPSQPGGEAACLLPDVAPDAFRLAECNGSGADIWNQQYWNDLSGQNEYAVPDPKSKGKTYIQ